MMNILWISTDDEYIMDINIWWISGQHEWVKNKYICQISRVENG